MEEFKRAFHHPREVLLFNNAGVGQIPLSARQVIGDWSTRFCEEGDRAFFAAYAGVDELRSRLARFLGGEREGTLFFSNTASAISQVAFGLDLEPGDEIVVWDQEYPSNFYPWKLAAERSGAKLIVARSQANLATPVDSLISHVTERTKVIATSWVQYRSGAITDLKRLTEFARMRDIFTCADIIQGAGVLPFDFKASGLDAACGGSHKWLVSPSGVGYLMLQPHHLNRLSPLAVGAMSYGNWDDLSNLMATLKDNSDRYEPGAKNLLELLAFNESMRLFMSVGITAIANEARRLAVRLAEGLMALEYQVNSPHGEPLLESFQGAIVNFSPTPRSPLKNIEGIESRLQKKQVSYGKRPPGIRLSPHAFTLDEHVDRVLSLLGQNL